MHLLRNEAPQVEKWLRRLRTKMPLAVVLGGGHHGLSFVRSLCRRDVPTLLLDGLNNVAFYSRHGWGCLLGPIEEAASEWLSILEFVGSRLERPGAVFVTSDPLLLFLSKHRQEIGRFFRFIVPGSGTVEQILNKRAQYAIAEKAGIALPRTVYPGSMADVRSWAAEISYPSILKPYSFEGRKTIGRKALLLHSAAQLMEEYGRVSDSGQGFMVQEVIPGGRSGSAYHGFWDNKGEEKAWYTKKVLRGTLFDYSSFHITADVPEVAALSRRLLAAFDYRGFSHVEFKLDPRDNTYRLMEINARTGQPNQHGIVAGVDFPWMGYRYLTGAGIADAPDSTFKRGVTFLNERVELELWRSGAIPFSTLFRSFMTANAKAYWAWNDPGPFLALAYMGRRKPSPQKPAFSV